MRPRRVISLDKGDDRLFHSAGLAKFIGATSRRDAGSLYNTEEVLLRGELINEREISLFLPPFLCFLLLSSPSVAQHVRPEIARDGNRCLLFPCLGDRGL